MSASDTGRVRNREQLDARPARASNCRLKVKTLTDCRFVSPDPIGSAWAWPLTSLAANSPSSCEAHHATLSRPDDGPGPAGLACLSLGARRRRAQTIGRDVGPGRSPADDGPSEDQGV